MKKLFYLMSCALVAFACSKDNGTNGPVIVNKDDILVGKKEVLDPDTQKQKLEQVANKFIDLFPAKEYEGLIEVSAAFASHSDRYFNDESYDWSDLEADFEGIFEKLYDEKQKSEYKWEYTYTLFLSNCTGTVTLGKRSAEYESSKDTKLIIEDVEGEDWELTLAYKNTKTVNFGEWVDTWYGYEYDYDKWEYVEVEYENLYKISVEIPESLTFEVKRDGKFFAKVTANFDYSISKDGVDYQKDRFAVSVEAEIDDLIFNVNKAEMNSETGDVSWNVSVKKGGMFLFSLAVSGHADMVYKEEDGEIVEAEAKSATMNMDFNLLGELQLKGSCSNLIDFSDLVDAYYENEKDCDRAARKATELLVLNVYYDCTPTVQAHIEVEPVYDYGEYFLEPVIVFEDGSRYSFEKYFKERDFKELIDNFEDMIFDYEDMVEDIYE